MTTQLITVDDIGGITSLQFKGGHGIDLREFGTAEIERTTEIVWVKAEQKWGIKFLRGELKGWVTMATLLMYAGAAQGFDGKTSMVLPRSLAQRLAFWRKPKCALVPLWCEYDDAVKAEIVIVQNFRQLGGIC